MWNARPAGCWVFEASYISRRQEDTGSMAEAAMTELQQQIEEVRREAYAAGYAAAMQVISELASRPAPKAGTAAAAPGRRGRGRVRQAAPAAKPTRSRRA